MIFTDNYYNIMSAQIAPSGGSFFTQTVFTCANPVKTTSGTDQTTLYSTYNGSSSNYWYGLSIFAILTLRNIGKEYFNYSGGTEPIMPTVWNGTTTAYAGLRYSVEQTNGISRTDYTMENNSLKNYCTLTNAGNQSWQLTVYNSSSSAISFNTFKLGIQMNRQSGGNSTYLYLIAEHDLGENTLQPGDSITFNIRRPYANEVT